MKYATENDFEVTEEDGGITVLFKPTQSHYRFRRLADPKEIDRFGPLSPARVRHAGHSGDTGEYRPDQVFKMASSLAMKKA